jgi:hypothetical protein
MYHSLRCSIENDLLGIKEKCEIQIHRMSIFTITFQNESPYKSKI